MSPHRVWMNLEERGSAPQRQELLLGRRFAAVWGIGHDSLTSQPAAAGTADEVTFGSAMLPFGRTSIANAWRANPGPPPLWRSRKCPKFAAFFGRGKFEWLFLSEICIHFSDKKMRDLKDLIILRIASDTQNNVWTAADFLDLGNRDAVDKALQRLVTAQAIRRIDRGLYDKPGYNRLTRKSNPPDPRRVIDAVARRDQIRILVDGMTAANDLGLTNAVPAKIVVHTDARLRPIKLGNLNITFRPTAPSKLFWAGRPAMRAVQALHWLRDVLGDPEENRRVTSILRRLFQNGEAGRKISEDLHEGLSSLPSWMQEFLRPLLENETKTA